MLESKWGLRFVSLFLALFMFITVNNEFGSLFTSEDDTGSITEIIEAVPVEILYNSDEYYIDGVPETVNVELYGNSTNVMRLQTTRDLSVILDLRNRSVGEYTEIFRIEGLPSNVTGEVLPRTTQVSIQDITSQSFEVEVEYDEERVIDDVSVSNIQITPETVEVTGGQNVVNKVSHVIASLTGTSVINSDLTANGEIVVYDEDFNPLDVRINPSVVSIELDVENNSKEVPVQYNTPGTVSQNSQIDEVNLSQESVVIHGAYEDIKDIDKVSIEIDLSGINEDTTRNITIPKPDGVEYIEPSSIEAEIKIKETTNN